MLGRDGKEAWEKAFDQKERERVCAVDVKRRHEVRINQEYSPKRVDLRKNRLPFF